MRYVMIGLACLLFAGCGEKKGQNATERLDFALRRLTAADSAEKRFYALGAAAKESFIAGKIEDARKYAQELLGMLPDFKDNREYASAIHDGNIVLGRIAVREGRMDDARKFLIEAAQTPGTPQMMNYGPNMALAKDLLDKGEKDVVVDYLQLCRRFWSNDDGRLDRWTQEIKDGKTPDFGLNLTY